MEKTFLNFSFEYWPVLLLSLIPAAINLCILTYVLLFVKRSSLSTVFIAFLLALLLWRLEESLLFISSTEETARLWEKMFVFPTSFVTAIGLHFILLLIRKDKLNSNHWNLLFLYLPPLVFAMLVTSGIARFSFKHTEIWGWVLEPSNKLSSAYLLLMGLQAFLMFVMLAAHVWRLRKSGSTDFYRSIIILVGLLIPILIGGIFQVILPVFFHLNSIPIASACVVFFSFSVLVAMTRYDFLDFSPRYQWGSIVENMNEGILISDKYDVIRYVNNKFCSISGYSHHDMIGKSVRDMLIFPEDKQTTSDHFINTENQTNGNYELQIRKANGDPILCEISSRPYIDIQNKIAGTIRIYNDITKRKKSETELREKMKEMDAFIYRASHDLRGPLASIAGLIALGKKEVTDHEAIFYFEKISSSIERLDDILHELSKMAHVTQAKIAPSEIDLEKEIDEILKSLSHLPNYPHLEFIKKIEDPIIYCDKILLIIILQNLIINAINYYDENKNKPYVQISAHKTPNYIEITVSDNGIGIPAQLHDKVFEMFYRGTTASKGSGLGLYIVKNAIQKLNGKIILTSSEQTGTTFILQFPEVATYI